MIFKSICILIFLIGFIHSYAQIEYKSSFSIGSNSSELAYKSAIDPQGNVYLTGSISDIADFDPGLSTSLLMSSGETDAFLAKYDQNFNLQFAFGIGGEFTDYGISLIIDESQNIYISGVFQGDVDFDPSAEEQTLHSNGDWDSFIAKYDPYGNLQFAFNIGGEGADIAQIKLDHFNNIIVSGTFQGTVDFDLGTDVNQLSAISFSEIFVAKYSQSLDLLFVKSIGAQDIDLSVGDFSVNNNNEIIISGGFYGLVDFDPGDGTAFLSSSGYDDAYLVKLSPDGDFVFAVKIGGIGSESAYGISVDEQGNLYVTGTFTDTLDANPGIDEFLINPLGTGDIFFIKLTPVGEFVNSITIDSENGWNTVYQLLIIGDETIYLTGSFESTIDFDPDSGEALRTSIGATDIFLAQYDKDLNYIDAITIGGSEFDYGYSCAVSPEGDIYLTGSFSDAADFDPGDEEAVLTSSGYEDIFLAKYSTAPNGTFQPGGKTDITALTVFPNPATDVVTIKAGTILQQAEVKIYDISGLLLRSFHDLRGNEISLNIKGLPGGMYVIEVRDGDYSWKEKVVVGE